MNILVTGGAGFLGINLIRHLLQQNGGRITSLDLADFIYPEADRITTIRGDIRRPETVEKAMEGVDAVVHAASALPLYSDEDIRSTVVDGTRTLLEEASKRGIRRFVFVSSTAVYGIPKSCPVPETAEMVGVGPYGTCKIEAEALCREYRDRGLVVTIVRPKSFVGPERLGVFELLYDWAHRGRSFPMIGKGNNRYQLLDVEDLSRFISLALDSDVSMANDVFNVGAAEFGTMKEDFQAVLDTAGHGKRMVPIPAAPVKVVLRLLETFRLSPLYGWVYETAGKESVVDIAKARNVLGFEPRFSNRDALLRNFAWYRENLDIIGNAAGTDHRSPWKRGVLSFVEKFF